MSGRRAFTARWRPFHRQHPYAPVIGWDEVAEIDQAGYERMMLDVHRTPITETLRLLREKLKT